MRLAKPDYFIRVFVLIRVFVNASVGRDPIGKFASRLVPFILIASLIGCHHKINHRKQEKQSSTLEKKPGISQPNLVIILADDLGYADVGFHGSDIQTPNLDRLAADGVRLEGFYACPMCSPTRAGLMTGRYPLRFGLMRSVIPPYRNFGLDTAEYTLPEMLEAAGYAHRACIGKWHLGHLQSKWHPNNQGFSSFVGCYNGAADYFTREREGEVDWHRDKETIKEKGYTTDLITQSAIDFITKVPRDEPYFLYVPYTAPHSPFQAKKEDLAKYPNREGDKRTYAAMVDCMDQGIGKILASINQRGDRDNTFILFFSDNGGVAGVGDNSPMKGSKLTVFEGGIRVVAAAHWPRGRIAGGRVVDARMGYIDVFPTFMAVAGVDRVPNPLDGINVLEAMKGRGRTENRTWFTYLDQNPDKQEHLALHRNGWKAIIERSAPDAPEKKVNSRLLYRLDDSRIEKENLLPTNQKIYQELSTEIEEFLKLKSKNQIPRYPEGQRGFKAPKDWIVE